MYRKNVASQTFCFQGVDATTGGIKSGVTWTVRRCIDGTFAAATGTVTEDGTAGWYKMALSQADTNGNDIGFNFTGTGAVPQTVNIITTAADPTDAVHFGLTALPNTACTTNASLLTSGTGTDQLSVAAGLTNITQAAADKAWSTAARVLTAGTNIQLPSNGLANVVAWTVAITGNITGNLSGSVASVTGNLGGNVVGTVASVIGAVGSVTGLTASNLDATISSRLASASYTAPPTAAQNATAVLTTQMTESYAALHAVPTLAQIAFEMRSLAAGKAVATTVLTAYKMDGTTPAGTYTLSDATSPVSITRAS